MDLPSEAAGAAWIERMARVMESRAVLCGLVLLGAALRIATYAADRSLWLDEAALAHNVLGRTFAGLAAPLDYTQIAPLGFLWLEKAAVLLFGGSELALRLVPLLASLSALALFAVAARRLLRGLAAPFAVLLFAVAPPLLYFASETKQYSLDTAAAAAIFVMALAVRRRPALRWSLAAGAAGALLPWFSMPSVFGLGAAGAYLAQPLVPGRRWRALAALVPLFLLWALGGITAIVHARHTLLPADARILASYWAGAFVPISGGIGATVRWLAELVWGAFVWNFPERLRVAALVLFALGAARLAWRRDGSLTLVLGPALLALIASALHLYPLFARLTLFVVPAIVLVAGAGAELLLALAGERRVLRASVLAPLGVLALLALAAARYLPTTREELRPVARYVARHRRAGDVIYVYYGAAPAFRYYAPRVGIPRADYVVGACARSDWRRYTAELDSLRGRPRVWLVLSHAFVRGGIREDSLFTRYLARIGRRVEGVETVGALGALYDLSVRPAGDTGAFTPPPSGNDAGALEQCFGVVTGTR